MGWGLRAVLSGASEGAAPSPPGMGWVATVLGGGGVGRSPCDPQLLPLNPRDNEPVCPALSIALVPQRCHLVGQLPT